MKAGQYIVQTLRRLATALLRAIFGTILWAGASVIGIAGEVICGVFVSCWACLLRLFQ